jgi:hypothetical protein
MHDKFGQHKNEYNAEIASTLLQNKHGSSSLYA